MLEQCFAQLSVLGGEWHDGWTLVPSPTLPTLSSPWTSCTLLYPSAGPLPFPYPRAWAGRQLRLCLSCPLHEVKQYKHRLSQGWDWVSSPGMLQLPDYQRHLFQISVLFLLIQSGWKISQPSTNLSSSKVSVQVAVPLCTFCTKTNDSEHCMRQN